MERSDQQLTLKVHLIGLIAYVPDNDKLWALFPNGVSASPAPWSATAANKYLRARAPHFALLVADRDTIDDDNTNASIYSTFEPFKSSNVSSSSYPLTASRKVVSLILQSGLDFKLGGDPLRVKRKVRKFFPSLQSIAPLHSSVDGQYNPDGYNPDDRSKGFAWKSLSTAIPLNTGSLSVKEYFGPDDKTKVDFGYVKVNAMGDLDFEGRVWKRRVANHLVWKAKLPPGARRVVLERLHWEDGTKTYYSLKPARDSNDIEIAIVNSEIEVPALFLEDAVLDEGVSGFPDPDFDLLYSLSVNKNQQEMRRYPVPKAKDKGKLSKTCAGGIFTGFANDKS